MLTLGFQPERLELHLIRGADFVAELEHQNAAGAPTDWPVGTTLSLVFDNGQVWTATITGAIARFDVDKATSDIPGDGEAVSLKYVNGDTDETWAIGQVRRHG